jgi:CelD/BcsL family acetyltransferase involved in cellulose biosynthesis
MPNYAISTRIDFDAHWAEKGNKDWLRKMRNRTARLGSVDLEIDAPGAAVWTIERWHEKFEGDEMGETLTTEDALAATAYCMANDRMRSFRLLIDGEPVAGMNIFLHGTTMATTHSYSDPAYAQAGVGVHLHELMFRWAAESPYERVDMGCGEYKGRWANESGTRTSFAIAPAHLAVARTGKELLRRLLPGGSAHDITMSTQHEQKQKLDSPV